MKEIVHGTKIYQNDLADKLLYILPNTKQI